MFKWFKCWRTGHRPQFVRNVYGDEINTRGGARSIWQCTHCGATLHQAALHRV